MRLHIQSVQLCTGDFIMSDILGESLGYNIKNLGTDVKYVSIRIIDSALNDDLGSEIRGIVLQPIMSASPKVIVNTVLYRRAQL
jgi:hypothetical protein